MTDVVRDVVAPEDLEATVTEWLEQHWDPELPVEDWWRLVGRAGWTAPHLSPEEGHLEVCRGDHEHLGCLRPDPVVP